VTEADSIEALRANLPGMILDLLEENGVPDPSDCQAAANPMI